MHIDSKQLEETQFGCRMNNMPEDCKYTFNGPSCPVFNRRVLVFPSRHTYKLPRDFYDNQETGYMLLRGRCDVMLAVTPKAACLLAEYDLKHGDQQSEAVTLNLQTLSVYSPVSAQEALSSVFDSTGKLRSAAGYVRLPPQKPDAVYQTNWLWLSSTYTGWNDTALYSFSYNRASGLPAPHSLHLDALGNSKSCRLLRLKINLCIWVDAIETGHMQAEESLRNLKLGKACVAAMRAKRQRKTCAQQKKNREAMHDQSRKMEE